ncbi:HNH/ENDO VII superfamily nuclease [Nocardioides sp. J9]|uniref:HNH/ENDO VII family nuclease n=1 Tax=Nocardioides sp. J9 TaxID=935844 RepID=UPI0011AB18A2|nr:HNH/ENDO VII family nuclease [Nocardioides sp. J9]TWG97359.1 HNH/ENDO VII superfamily nuclease [Nocardioides sp. J9]
MGRMKPVVKALRDAGDSLGNQARRLRGVADNHRTHLETGRSRRLDTDRDAARGAGAGAPTPRERIPKAGKYSRPSGYRKGVRDKVWEAAKGPDGVVKDPVTGQIIKQTDKWDMGHLPGMEFRKAADYAEAHGWTRKQFLDWHNDPSHYRPELPSSNRSHRGEDMSDLFGFGG